MRTRIKIGAWRCEWISAVSWQLSWIRFTSYGWMEKVFFWDGSSPGEDAMKIIEMTTKDLEYHINLVGKVGVGCARNESNFERYLLWVKYYQTAFHVMHPNVMLSHFSHVWLCDPMDCSLPASSIYGILQARIPEWVAKPFSRGSFIPMDWTHVFCIGQWVLITSTSIEKSKGRIYQKEERKNQ